MRNTTRAGVRLRKWGAPLGYRVPERLAPGHVVSRETILTVMDPIAVVLQPPNVPLLQHAVSHQQLQEPPVDVGHDASPPRAALCVRRS